MKSMSIKPVLFLFLLLSALLFLQIHPVHAADELFLTGIVKSIDHHTRTVLVNVSSSTCHGMRKFTVDDPAALDNFVNKKIDFSIDSSTCTRDEVYKMFPSVGGN